MEEIGIIFVKIQLYIWLFKKLFIYLQHMNDKGSNYMPLKIYRALDFLQLALFIITLVLIGIILFN